MSTNSESAAVFSMDFRTRALLMRGLRFRRYPIAEFEWLLLPATATERVVSSFGCMSNPPTKDAK